MFDGIKEKVAVQTEKAFDGIKEKGAEQAKKVFDKIGEKDVEQAKEVFAEFKRNDVEFRTHFDKILSDLYSGKLPVKEFNDKITELDKIVYNYETQYNMNINLLQALSDCEFGSKTKVEKFRRVINFKRILKKSKDQEIPFKYSKSSKIGKKYTEFVNNFDFDRIRRFNSIKDETLLAKECGVSQDSVKDLFTEFSRLQDAEARYLPNYASVLEFSEKGDSAFDSINERYAAFQKLYNECQHYITVSRDLAHVARMNDITATVHKTVVMEKGKAKRDENGNIICRVGDEFVHVANSAAGMEKLYSMYCKYRGKQQKKKNETPKMMVEPTKAPVVNPDESMKRRMQKAKEMPKKETPQNIVESKEETFQNVVEEKNDIPAIVGFSNIDSPDELIETIRKSGEANELSGKALDTYMNAVLNESATLENAIKKAKETVSIMEPDATTVYKPVETTVAPDSAEAYKPAEDTQLPVPDIEPIEPDATTVYKPAEITNVGGVTVVTENDHLGYRQSGYASPEIAGNLEKTEIYNSATVDTASVVPEIPTQNTLMDEVVGEYELMNSDYKQDMSGLDKFNFPGYTSIPLDYEQSVQTQESGKTR